MDQLWRTVIGEEYHKLFKSGNLKDPPPFGLAIFKESKFVILNRETATNFARHKVSKVFLEWLEDTEAPDEFFFATLSRVDFSSMTMTSETSVTQDMTQTKNKVPVGLCPKLVFWDHQRPCHGEVIRGICSFSTLDLPELWRANLKHLDENISVNDNGSDAMTDSCFLANKFNLDVDPLAVLCQARSLIMNHNTEDSPHAK